MKNYFISFLLLIFIFTFIACQNQRKDKSIQKEVEQDKENNSVKTGSNYDADLQKLLNAFCMCQKKMFEIKDKTQEYQSKGKTMSFEELEKLNEELAKYQNEYNNLLQDMMNTYKGKERDIHNELKKIQQKCR